MSVTKDEVKHIAKLAKLEFNDEEINRYTDDLNEILGYVDKLNELDTENVEPLSHPIEGSNVFREDKLRKSVDTEEALKNAPESTSEYFRVPKVIKTD